MSSHAWEDSKCERQTQDLDPCSLKQSLSNLKRGTAYGCVTRAVPVQVDAIITRAEPYMHSAKKRARRLSVVASDYVRRHSFGPAQAKAHEM